MNPDGSISLGLRKQQQQQQQREQQQGLQLVPETVLRQNSLPPMNTAATLTQYSVYNKYHSETPQSLDDDHRLAPIGVTLLATPNDRQTSLSPASFLSPTRKRSFGEATDHTSPSESDTTTKNNKRLSSIKTLLNPALLSGSGGASGPSSQHRWPASPTRTISAENLSHQQRAYNNGDSPPPGSTPASAPSPGAYSNASSSVAAGPSAACGYADPALRRPSGTESEAIRAERRAALRREAQRMREMLAANERELAELGN